MKWRWDQGRLGYFQFDEIRNIANALLAFEGKALPEGDELDSLRTILENYSEQPFAPQTYKVWRNYKRVFGCQLLAVELNRVVFCTELCRKIANGTIDVDDYLAHVATRFCYPSPVFEDYTPAANQIFPICAVIKLLIAEFIGKKKTTISIEEIIEKLKGNKVHGNEPISYYLNLKSSVQNIIPDADEFRQIRELLKFISQFSFLKWNNPNLLLDVASEEEALLIEQIINPILGIRESNPAKEILRLGGNCTAGLMEKVEAIEVVANEQEFIEGNRIRVTHLRVERSTKLKEIFFSHKNDPHRCDMCNMDTQTRYPWANRLVELHHLLPLASPIRVETKTTSLADIVGLCPSCHRATHKFYSKWLREKKQKDFSSYKEAKLVYQKAKDNIAI